MRLLIARHGATVNDAEARYTGQSDLSLSALGERQAEALAAALASERLVCLVSSDLHCARATAEAIARYHDLPVLADSDLRGIAMGEWEGHTYAEVQAHAPDAIRRWQEDAVAVAPPGGETVAELRDRLVGALDRWFAAYPTGRVLWVTHSDVAGVLLCHLLGMALHRHRQFRSDHAALTEIKIGVAEQGAPHHVLGRYATVHHLNDTSHLRVVNDEERMVLAEHPAVL